MAARKDVGYITLGISLHLFVTSDHSPEWSTRAIRARKAPWGVLSEGRCCTSCKTLRSSASSHTPCTLNLAYVAEQHFHAKWRRPLNTRLTCSKRTLLSKTRKTRIAISDNRCSQGNGSRWPAMGNRGTCWLKLPSVILSIPIKSLPTYAYQKIALRDTSCSHRTKVARLPIYQHLAYSPESRSPSNYQSIAFSLHP